MDFYSFICQMPGMVPPYTPQELNYKDLPPDEFELQKWIKFTWGKLPANYLEKRSSYEKVKVYFDCDEKNINSPHSQFLETIRHLIDTGEINKNTNVQELQTIEESIKEFEHAKSLIYTSEKRSRF